MVDAIAVMIVTAILIPLVTLLFLIWVVKLFFGIDLQPYVHKPSIVSKGVKKLQGNTTTSSASKELTTSTQEDSKI